MNRVVLIFALSVCACDNLNGNDAAHGQEESHAEDAHSDDAHSQGSDHSDEVHLSAEASELAGIRVGVAERRSLTGGVAIPAEVKFEPTSTAHVGPLVSGRITRVAAALGDRVKPGQLLAVVASSDASEVRARLDSTRAKLGAAESTLRRQQQLSTEGIGAEKLLIEAQAQVAELRSELKGLRRQLAVFGAAGGGSIALKSPIDGVVVSVHATLGETATPDQSAFIVTDPTKVWVRGNVPELEIGHVQQGSTAVVRLHAFPELVMSGTITYVAPALDEGTRSLPIRVTLETPDPRLRSGLFGSVEFVGRADERPVVIPASAVATLDGQTVVFVPGDEPNSFRPKAVSLGRRAAGRFEVRNGLKEGAPVVVDGAFTLKSALRSEELSEGHAH